MASIVSEGANFRKTDFAFGEFCDQPMAQVHPEPTVSNGGFLTVNAARPQRDDQWPVHAKRARKDQMARRFLQGCSPCAHVDNGLATLRIGKRRGVNHMCAACCYFSLRLLT